MNIQKISNYRILNELTLSPEALFAFYVAGKFLNESSICAIKSDRICSLSICGGDHNLFEAHQSWILAKDQSSFDLMLGHLIDAKVYDSFSSVLSFVENSKLKSTLQISKDFLYVLRCSENQFIDATDRLGYQVLKVSKSNLPNFKISSEMREKIGPFSDFLEGCNFWALIDGNEIIGVCDALVNFSGHASIQQVYILSKYRGRGLSKMMFPVLTYIVAERNLPSIMLAESLGFKKENELADVIIG